MSTERTEQTSDTLSDTLNERIGVLTRREVEARILGPIIAAFEEEFGSDRVREILSKQIIEIARRQGAQMAASMDDDSLQAFNDTLKYWTMGGALEIDVQESDETALSFDVTRCRYAELYRALGVPELGAILSCNRDYALIEGFNGDIELTRTQTIMEGAPCCDFRYRLAQEDTAATR